MPRYNARPSQALPILPDDQPEELVPAVWGLVFPWGKGKSVINARAETLMEKPSFARLFKAQRCLIPADGFYEWGNEGGRKIPYRFELKSRGVFAFAGLWDRDPAGPGRRFVIITTRPNELVATVHDRMPAILPPGREREWLDRAASADRLVQMLGPYPPEQMAGYSVSRLVNSAKAEGPEVIRPQGKP